MKNKVLLLVCVVLVVAGVIMSHVMAGGLVQNQYTGDFVQENPHTSILISTLACIAAALIFSIWLYQWASERGVKVIPVLSGGSLSAFGLLHGLFAVNLKAARILRNFMDNWSWRNEPVMDSMPENYDKFSSITRTYGLLMIVALAAFLLFACLDILKIKKGSARRPVRDRDISFD